MPGGAGEVLGGTGPVVGPAGVGLSRKQERLSYGVRGFYSTIWDYIMPVPTEVDWWVAPSDGINPPHVLGRNFSSFPLRYDVGTSGENVDTPAAAYQYANVDLATLCGGDVSAQYQVADGLPGMNSGSRGPTCASLAGTSNGRAPRFSVPERRL